jgi:hypothetical protein
MCLHDAYTYVQAKKSLLGLCNRHQQIWARAAVETFSFTNCSAWSNPARHARISIFVVSITSHPGMRVSDRLRGITLVGVVHHVLTLGLRRQLLLLLLLLLTPVPPSDHLRHVTTLDARNLAEVRSQ